MEKEQGIEVKTELSPAENADAELKVEGEPTPDEELAKVVQPEGEIEIPIGDGKRKKVFWARIGFESRVFFRSFFKKKLKEAVEVGLLGTEGRYKGDPVGAIDGKNTVFSLDPTSIDEKTLVVSEGSTLRKPDEYSYSQDLRVLFFHKAPQQKVTVEYDYYDDECFTSLFNDAFVIIMIFMCARDLKNHKKRIFSCVDEVGALTLMEINEIINLYSAIRPFNKIATDGEKLKN